MTSTGLLPLPLLLAVRGDSGGAGRGYIWRAGGRERARGGEGREVSGVEAICLSQRVEPAPGVGYGGAAPVCSKGKEEGWVGGGNTAQQAEGCRYDLCGLSPDL